MTHECPITFEPIPDDYLCFLGQQPYDLRALSQYLGTAGTPINPTTGEDLDQDTIDSIMSRGRIVFVLFDTRKTRPGIEVVGQDLEPQIKNMNRYSNTVGDLAWIFSGISNTFQTVYCFTPDGEPIAVHLADYNLTLDQFFSKPVYEHQNQKLVCVGTPNEANAVKNRRAETVSLKTLASTKCSAYHKMVPMAFRGPPPPVTPINDCMEMIKAVLSCHDESTSEFADTFCDVRITAEQFRELYWFIKEIDVNDDFNHILIAKVVDKWNLGSIEGTALQNHDLESLRRLEEEYYAGRYQTPSFRVTVELD